MWWSKTRCKLKRALLLPVLLLGVEPAHAVVAGGMVSTTRTWPETANGYDDMAWFIQIVKEPGFNGRTFWAHQYWFKNGNGGYLGLQARNGNDKYFNFSMSHAIGWVNGPFSNCRHFSHEGVGVQCDIRYPWRAGVKYEQRLIKTGSSKWTAYIKDLSSGVETLVATIVVPSTWGGLQARSAEFLEDFAQGADQHKSCSEVPATTAVYYQPKVNNGSLPSSQTTAYTYGVCHAVARVSCTADQDCIAYGNTPANATPFLVKNTSSSYCLDLLGGGEQAGLGTCAQNDNQKATETEYSQWTLRTANQCLEAVETREVRLASCNASSAQRWLWLPIDSAVYNIGTGECLEPTGDAGPNAPLRTHQCLSNDLQKWERTPHEKGGAG